LLTLFGLLKTALLKAFWHSPKSLDSFHSAV
jgi:hypothetical protein